VSINNQKLNESLIQLSQNEVFYMGLLEAGEKIITREICNMLNVDMASIWLYNKDRDSILLQELYTKKDGVFQQNESLHKSDFEPYFIALEDDPIIIANDAEVHPATSCFLDGYLKPLGIKSMLDVPVWYRGSLIGVICIESLSLRSWEKEEVYFAQLLSSLYSFAYSMKESNMLSSIIANKEMQLFNRMEAINRSNAVIEFTIDGIIKYANEAFLKTMGYSAEELVGKHHSIFVVNEEKASDDYKTFWKTLKSGDYFSGDVVRKKKDGSLVYLQATYNPIIGEDGKPYSVMKIATNITQSIHQQMEIIKKNTYLEHAAKILRHDMHSGINTYIPRGISSLDRRLGPEMIEKLKIEAPLKMIKEGLRHTQKVYRGVYEFTNLVKKDAVLSRTDCNLKGALEDYLSATAYRAQVILEDLGFAYVNESLFCTAIDNLIRNGLRYNDSDSKFVKIYRTDNQIYVEDNGRGLTREEFTHLSKPYIRKEGQAESGSGLGLNICIAILEEHGFSVDCEKKPNGGTKIIVQM
jgi:PAS domain S-box-containing protein